MKKRFCVLFITLLIMLGIVGCNNVEPPLSVQSETPSFSTPSYDVAVTLNNIHIDRVTDKLLDKYNSFHEYINNEDGDRLIIWTDAEIKDFAFISVDHNDKGDKISFITGDILTSIDELLPEKPFVVKLLIPGLVPAHGISFVDKNGVKRYYTINLSGRGEEEGAPYFLLEFENGNSK